MEEKLKMGFKLIMSGEYGNVSGGLFKGNRIFNSSYWIN